MIHNAVRSAIYFCVCIAVQILVLNNIHFLRVAIPFFYLYFIIKIPLGYSRSYILILSFITGLIIDAFSNTPGMHTAACTLAGFARESLIQFFIGKDLPYDTFPSYKSFGYGGFIRYVVTFVSIHHITLYLLESITLFDPLLILIRIVASVLMTSILICAVEAFNLEAQKSGE